MDAFLYNVFLIMSKVTVTTTATTTTHVTILCSVASITNTAVIAVTFLGQMT